MAIRSALVLLALSVAACLSPSPNDVTWKSSGNVGCAFWPWSGTLVEIDGRTAIAGATYMNGPPAEAPLIVRWPDGWRVGWVPGGLEVRDAIGKVQARTGFPVAVYGATGDPISPGSPRIVDGALLACPFDPISED